MAAPEATRYDAFVSYSHSDQHVAAAIQSGLQRFVKRWNQRRALAVFRDKASLAASASLAGSLRGALDDSRYLILIASPDAARSRWVEQELEYWLATKSVETILPVIVGGQWTWDDEQRRFVDSDDCPIPPVLHDVYPDEPLFVDARQIEP